MELINKIKAKVSKKEFIFILLFSLTVVFNFFIFNQFDVMFHNQAEFGVNIPEIVWAFVWRGFLIFLVLVSLLTALSYRSKSKFKYLVAFLIGLIIAGYMQVLFLNKENQMTVRGTMREESVLQYIVNSLIYGGLIILPLILVKYEKKKTKINTTKLASSAIIIILGMQLMGIVSIASTSPKPAENNELYYFSIKEQLKLSKKENIVIFLLDRFDTIIADNIFENHPESKDIFDGFTYYQNNISEYPGTFPSVAGMLTNKTFNRKTNRQIEYLQSAWRDEVLFDALHDNDFKVNGLIDTLSTTYDVKSLEGKFDNIRKMEVKDRKIRGGDFYNAMLSFASVRQSPDALKEVFVNKRFYDISNYCIEVKNTPDYFPRTISASADLKFYHRLTNTGLSADEDKKVFSFVHLQASHGYYEYNHNLERDKFDKVPTLDRAISQTRGTFKLLEEYFNQMKQLGIYDNSTIILVGDHGIWNNKAEVTNAVTTSLLIKEKNASFKLKYDRNTELSNHNFHATLLQLIGENGKTNSESYYDIINGDGAQTRYFYYVRWTNLNSCAYLGTYEVKGDAKNIANWRKMGEKEHS